HSPPQSPKNDRRQGDEAQKKSACLAPGRRQMYDMMIALRKMNAPARMLALCLLVAGFSSGCNYLVDGVRYLAQEDYVGGGEALGRVRAAALVGYAVRVGNNQATTEDALAPALSALSTRIKRDRDYLETSVRSCEDTMLLTNVFTSDLSQHILA